MSQHDPEDYGQCIAGDGERRLQELYVSSASSFVVNNPSLVDRRSSSSSLMAGTFEIMVALPPRKLNLQAQMKIESVLPGPSEIVEVRYKLPFGLDVVPKDNLAICTKDGAGGEKVGDILRFTTHWNMGLPMGDGVVTTVASFAGGLSWQCTMFDVTRAEQWEAVVEALVSNVPDRTDEVVLIFERPLVE